MAGHDRKCKFFYSCGHELCWTHTENPCPEYERVQGSDYYGGKPAPFHVTPATTRRRELEREILARIPAKRAR